LNPLVDFVVQPRGIPPQPIALREQALLLFPADRRVTPTCDSEDFFLPDEACHVLSPLLPKWSFVTAYTYSLRTEEEKLILG